MAPGTDKLLDQMVQAIVAEVDPEQVLLFGSRAQGNARENSDVEALIRLYQALVEFPVPAGIPHLPYNPSETETCPAVIARTAPN